MSPLAEELWLDRLVSYKDVRGILRFADEELRVAPDPWQEEALLLFESPRPQDRRIALQACAGPGKSAVMAWAGWWFLSTQGERGEHPRGAAVSVTDANLQDNLWAEFAKWQARSEYLSLAFTLTSSDIYANDHPNTWFLSARSWPKNATPEEQGKTLSGLHSKYVLALIDESGTIPITVLKAAEQALSNCVFGKILQSGNPISLEGMLHAAATIVRHLWQRIRITGDPDDPKAWVHSPRIAALHQPSDGEHCACPRCWARQQIEAFGREDPWVKAYILGQFPPASINALVTLEEVEAAQGKHLRADAYEWSQRRLGIDVARYGDDRTVIFPRQGLASFRPIVMRHTHGDNVSTDIATRVLAAKARWGSEVELMDATGGWGAGARDVLSVAGHPPIEVQFAGRARDPRYANQRSEIWFLMAQWIRKGGAMPRIPEMVPELTVPTYTFTGVGEGKFLVEPKKLVKKRLGRSPDLADALAVTFGLPEMPKGAQQRRQQRAASEWDPFTVRE